MSLKQKSYPADQISKIDVRCKIFRICVEGFASDRIGLSWRDSVMRTLEIKEKDGTILVADHASIGIYGTLALIDLKKDAQLLLKVPQDYRGKLILQTREESIQLTDVSILRDVGISTSTGEILLENVNAGLIDIRANVGKTHCYGIDASKAVYISSTRGDIFCNLCGAEDEYTISCATNARKNRGNGTHGNGDKSVQLNSAHGNIQYACLNGRSMRRPTTRYDRRRSFQEW